MKFSALICLCFLTLSLGACTQQTLWADMSSHNSTASDARVFARDGEFPFVAHRGAWGTSDPSVLEYDLLFEERAREASINGIYYGAYYLACTESAPESQADTFLTFLRHNLSKSQPVIVIFDWERIPSANCAVPEVSAYFTLRFAQHIQAITGHLPVIYTDARVLKAARAELDANPFLAEQLAVMPLWIARPSALKVVPKSSDLYPWSRWQFWQFTGMDHKFGLDYFNGSKKELGTFLRSAAWTAVE